MYVYTPGWNKYSCVNLLDHFTMSAHIGSRISDSHPAWPLAWDLMNPQGHCGD